MLKSEIVWLVIHCGEDNKAESKQKEERLEWLMLSVRWMKLHNEAEITVADCKNVFTC